MCNHVDAAAGYIQQDPGTFRLPRRTQRAWRSSISTLFTCTKSRGTTHGADDCGIDIEDDHLGGSIALEELRDDSNPLIFIMIRTSRAACAFIQRRRKTRI
jgi:hypothetical protein